jgi:hypothetical protein
LSKAVIEINTILVTSIELKNINMKKIFLFVILMGLSNFLFAQKYQKLQIELPDTVKNAFAKKYKTVKKVDWEKEGEDYEAEFEYNGNELSVLYAADGKLKQIATEIEKSAVPKSIVTYCEKNFMGLKITEASKIKDPAGNMTYEVELTRGKGKMAESFDAIFDKKGTMLSKTEPKPKKKD